LRRHVVVIFSLLFLTGLFADGAQANQYARTVPAKAAQLQQQTMAPSGRIVVKFTDDSALIVGTDGLIGGDRKTRQRVSALLAEKSFGLTLERRFSRSVEDVTADLARARARVHRDLPNLNRYGTLDLSGRGYDRDDLLRVVKAVLADPAVETAFLEPLAVPAALGFDAWTGKYTPPVFDPVDDDLPLAPEKATPNYQSLQGYLGAPPEGVNALAADALAGGRGAGMHMIDIELGWNWSHEDLPTPFITYGASSPDIDSRNHGTAVLGEIRGSDNGFGVRGITPDAQVGHSSAYNQSVANALYNASGALNEGDVMLIELHAPGPNALNDGTQFGYVCMEYWQDIFDAIQLVTANGRVVVEAAGNGTQNLDDPVYGSLFNRNFRDSGAIMCGAATSSGSPYSWSNNGSRVDLNGWGGNVVTCGYGDLYGSSIGEDVYYTRYFSGTSSASPIVTGAVVALQSMSKAAFDLTLDALTLRQFLADTGTPQLSGNIVGPRPDIMAAFTQLQWSLGQVSGTVTDSETGLPVADVLVSVPASGQTMLTGADGMYHFTTTVGFIDLDFSQFFYAGTSGVAEVAFDTPGVLDVSLDRHPTVDVVTRVSAQDGIDLTTTRVTPLDVPLTAIQGKAATDFTITGAPVGVPFDILVDNEPNHGADFLSVIPVESVEGFNLLTTQLAPATHNFDLWWESFVSSGENWTWGVPGGTAPASFSTDKCWGMGMTGFGYEPSLTDFLTSGQTNLYGHEQVLLSLHYWSDLEDGIDGVQMQIRGYNDIWESIAPLNGYSHDTVATLGMTPGWSGNSGGWQGAVFDITSYTDLLIVIRFKFTSDAEGTGTGFFVDDITFDTGDIVTPVLMEDEVPGLLNPVLTVAPNPFNPRTSIAWEITRPGSMALQIYDTRGRLVRTLMNEDSPATRGIAVWNGRDDAGAGLASGTYLVRVRESGGKSTTQRVTLIK